MNKKLVIFDFDGVLVNTSEIGYTLHTEANPNLTREYFANLSHGNFMENLEKAIAEDEYKVQEDWEDLYHGELLKLDSHDVIRGLILDLATKYQLAIVSSSKSYHITAFLEREGVRERFSDVLGSDVAYSKVQKISDLLKKYSVRPENAVFITDTLGDIREGTQCDVASIGVTWGTHDRDTLFEGAPYAIVDTVPLLEEAVHEVLA
jgi:phosphoglycolate phosphatase-like HAD superfamily hydrolase